MIFKNGEILLGDFAFKKTDIRIHEGRIREIGDNLAPHEGEETFDLKGKYLVPGFIDIHIHGAAGEDYSNGTVSGMKRMASYLASVGVTSFLPTSMTMPMDELLDLYKRTEDFMKDEENEGARLLGIYMEGPFFSFDKRGAQDENYLIHPEKAVFKELLDASKNTVRIISLAPELPGAMKFIEEIDKSKVTVALGHTVCNYDQAKEAFEKGATLVTHLFNGMLPFLHRAPGILGAASEREDIFCELICDGVHIHEAAIRLAFKLLSEDRIVLISDGLSTMGCPLDYTPKGGYKSGHRRIFLKDGAAKLKDGTLAGSNTPLSVCVKRAVSFGIKVESAIKAATINPAKVIFMDHETGSIEVGKLADLVIMDKELNVVKTFKEGKEVQPFSGYFPK